MKTKFLKILTEFLTLSLSSLHWERSFVTCWLLFSFSLLPKTSKTNSFVKVIEALGNVKKPVLKGIVALLSFGVVMGQTAITGGELDPTSVEIVIESLTVLLLSTGGYHLTKTKK